MNELSNFQINKLLRNDQNFGGCYSNDTFAKLAPTQLHKYYIVNLENHQLGGSHWVLVSALSSPIMYVDSFGAEPTIAVSNWITRTGRPAVYSSRQLQSLESQACGYFAIFIGHCLSRGLSLSAALNKLKGPPKRNEQILKKFFRIK